MAAPSAPIVTTKLGKVEGTVKKLGVDGEYMHLYHGIRYGKSTAGERRYKKPEPVEAWNGTYDATSLKNKFACSQRPSSVTGNNDVPSDVPFGEDCLFLNVWVPSAHSEKKRAVIFWIHGGGFESGTAFSMAYDARFFSSVGDIIVVTINYRLGPFGFLYGGTDDAPGNLGLYDQILALKWTKDNIEAFGGDPNAITIAGESAGGMSVGALVLSPLTKGLFKRAILQSGAPNSYLGSNSAEEAMVKAKDMIHELGCNQSSTISEQIECLRHKDTESILKYMEHAVVNGVNFEPIYDDKLMPIKPSKALIEGKFNDDIEILFGHVKDEGALFVLQFYRDLDPNEKPTITVSKAKGYIALLFTLVKKSFGSLAAQFYTEGLTDDDKVKLSQAVGASFGDFHITCPTVIFGKSFAQWKKTNKAYAYRLSHPPAIPAITTCSGWMGVCHGDDVIYLFGFPIAMRGIAFTEEDYKLSNDMIHIWSTFAKTGKPPSVGGVDWPEAIDRDMSNPSVRFMDLYPGKYRIIKNEYEKSCDGFWRSYL